MVMLKLHVSLHDATPFHMGRLRKADAFFRELGLGKVTYLLVPQYHGGYLSSQSPEFIDWCRADRAFKAQWHLHGYHHLEQVGEPDGKAQNSTRPGSVGDAWKRKFMTAGEGEFLALDADAMRSKIEDGRKVFRDCLGHDPEGFVAPAWLFNAGLPAALKDQGIRYTEDHRRLYRVDTGASLQSPVITWATRTLLRKYGSLVVCPALARLWASVPVLRVAMHPFDFDHASTIANIRGVLERLLKDREEVFSDDVDFPAGASGS
jgi:predicted deacetylase